MEAHHLWNDEQKKLEIEKQDKLMEEALESTFVCNICQERKSNVLLYGHLKECLHRFEVLYGVMKHCSKCNPPATQESRVERKIIEIPRPQTKETPNKRQKIQIECCLPQEICETEKRLPARKPIIFKIEESSYIFCKFGHLRSHDAKKWMLKNLPSSSEFHDSDEEREICDGCGKLEYCFLVHGLSRLKKKVAKHYFCEIQCSLNWLAIATQNLWEEAIVNDKKLSSKPLKTSNYSPHFNSSVGSQNTPSDE